MEFRSTKASRTNAVLGRQFRSTLINLKWQIKLYLNGDVVIPVYITNLSLSKGAATENVRAANNLAALYGDSIAMYSE